MPSQASETPPTTATREVPLLARGVGTFLPPQLRRWFWRSFYGLLVRLSRGSEVEFTCMNWGYSEDGADWPTDLGVEHYPKQLYLALVRGAELRGKEIAEISCGRGGGLATVHAHAGPAASHGIDITPGNIELCKQRFGQVPGLDFAVGDAMALPFADRSLDAVLSVEASHCYPDERQFAREAARVLRPGGWLLWTDFRVTNELPAFREALTKDFEEVEFTDISAKVLAAMAADAPRRQALITAASPRLLRGVLTYFAAASGDTESVRSFQRGERTYFLMKLRARESTS